MASGGSAIRGTRVGSGPMGEQDRGIQADRIAVSYWDAMGNETVRYFSAHIEPEEIPDIIDSPTTGLPAGGTRTTRLSCPSMSLTNPPRLRERTQDRQRGQADTGRRPHPAPPEKGRA